MQPLVYTDAAVDQLLDRNREPDVDEVTGEADDYLSVFKSAHFGQAPDRPSVTEAASDASVSELCRRHPTKAFSASLGFIRWCYPNSNVAAEIDATPEVRTRVFPRDARHRRCLVVRLASQSARGGNLEQTIRGVFKDPSLLTIRKKPENMADSVVGQKEIADFWDRLLRARHERVAAEDRGDEGDAAFRELHKRSCQSRNSQPAHAVNDDATAADGRTNSDDSDMELDSVYIAATASGHALLSNARIKTEPSASQAQSRKSRRVPKPTYTSLSNFHRVSRGDDTEEGRRSRALRGRGGRLAPVGDPLIRTGSENEEEQEQEAEGTEGEEG
ncbi:unnamed protein product, partial [Dibothriocephalus latus]